jgi:hypothetical protein
MQTFSKRTSIILNSISCLFLILGCVLIIISPDIIINVQSFLENVVFHRSFSLDKWAPTINALISFPIFFVIVLNAIFFLKFDNNNKNFIIFSVLVSLFVLMIYCFQTRSSAYMDSDMASEIMLAKECARTKCLWPRTWFYSTEIRMLNTQIISTPLFAFTQNWTLIKTLTAVISCALLFFSLLFLLSTLDIKKTWLKLLCGLLILAPCSVDYWIFLQFGNYYIPHIVLSFIYLGLFFSLVTPEHRNKTKIKFFTIIFWISTFMNGFATIRYIIIFVFPLALVVLYQAVDSLIKERKIFSFKAFFIDDKYVFYSVSGLLIGCIGYIFNTLILSNFYSFSEWNSTAYNTIGDITFLQLHRDLFSLIGYRNNISAMTPAGIINILIYAGIFFFLLCFISFFKNTQKNKKHFIYVVFSLASLILTGFIYINMEYYSRYFIMQFAFFIPCLAVFLEDASIKSIHRYILGVCWTVILTGSSFITLQNVLCTDLNSDKKGVMSYLEKNDLDFGYATFWNSNVFTFLSNGKIEIAHLDKTKVNGVSMLKDHYSYDKWLSPFYYYDKDYKKEERCFLLISKAEYKLSSGNNVFLNKSPAYEDSNYLIFVYDSPENFRNSF